MKTHDSLRGIVLSAMFLISAVPALADDYFDQITVFSHGRITRFVEMPITVYITPALQTKEYLSALRYAMRQWEAVSDGKVQFQETPASEEADISVRWGYSGAEQTDMTYGRAELTRHHVPRGEDSDRIGVWDFSVEIILSLPKPSVESRLSGGRDTDGLPA